MSSSPPSALGRTAEVPEADPAVVDLLGILRRQLRMDLAWLARLRGDFLVLQVINGDAASFHLRPGSTIRRSASLFTHVLSGELPHLIPDTHANPRSTQLGTVTELGIGSYAAVPIPDTEGGLYGLLGFLGHGPQPALCQRDSAFMRLAAEVLRESVADLRRLWELRSEVWRETNDVLESGGPGLVFQPLVDLSSGCVVGVEALSRFPPGRRSTEDWFAAAVSVGLGAELELAAVRRGLEFVDLLPPGVFLTVNASPTTVVAGLADVLADADLSKILVEVTEQERNAGSPEVLRNLDVLRARGARIAADDVGSGYAGLQQIVEIRPDIVKMDRSLTQHIDGDPVRRAVAGALVDVGKEIGAVVVAEGIETAGELRTVIDTGIGVGQGYYLGRPASPASLPVLFGRPGRRDGLAFAHS
jgi:EAL domain-containing protein (putative c-di-GMP-specific phosphodiesterase class I)